MFVIRVGLNWPRGPFPPPTKFYNTMQHTRYWYCALLAIAMRAALLSGLLRICFDTGASECAVALYTAHYYKCTVTHVVYSYSYWCRGAGAGTRAINHQCGDVPASYSCSRVTMLSLVVTGSLLYTHTHVCINTCKPAQLQTDRPHRATAYKCQKSNRVMLVQSSRAPPTIKTNYRCTPYPLNIL